MTNHTQRPIGAHLLWLAVFVCGCILVSLSSSTLAAAQDKGTVGGAIAQSPGNNQLFAPPSGATLTFNANSTTQFAVTNNTAYTLKAAYNLGGSQFTLICQTFIAGVGFTQTLGTFTAPIPVGNGAASFVCPANSTHIALMCGATPCTLLFVP